MERRHSVLDGSAELADLGKRIRERRLSLHLSQEEVAEMAGISAYTIGRIEGGRMAMSVGTFKKLVQALGVDVGVLLGMAASDAGESCCPDVFQSIRHLGRREQETVLQTVEKLLDRLGQGI